MNTLKLNNLIRFLLLLTILIVMLSGCEANNFSAKSGWSGAVTVDDTVYIGTQEARLAAFDKNTGDVLWQYPNTEEEDFKGLYGSPVVKDNLIYIGSYGESSGSLYSINIETRQKIWSFESDGHIVGSPVLTDKSVIFGTSNGTLYSLAIEDGVQEWNFQTGNKIWSTPVIEQDIIYLSSLDRNLYALTLEGKELWKFTTKGAIAATPLVADGTVYIGSFDKHFYAIDATKGTEQWSSPFRGDNWFWAKATSDESNIYAASLDGNIYAINKYNGSSSWNTPFDTKAPIVSDPVLIPSGLVVANHNGDVFLLDKDTGSELRSFSIKEPVRAPIKSSGTDSVIYISAMNHTVRAVNLEDTLWRDLWCYDSKEDRTCQSG